MRAAFYQGSRTFTTGEAPQPPPGPDEALLRVRRVGICGTDLHIFQGHLDRRVPKGGVIGHETFGEVVEAPAGRRLRARRPGRRRAGRLPRCLPRVRDGGLLPLLPAQGAGRGPAGRHAGVLGGRDEAPEPFSMFAHELVMHGSRLYARRDREEAIRLVASGAVPVTLLVSRRIPREALQQGMEEALGGGPVMKVLVEV